ncbi:2-amino-4-hydroxy-6-hydroxymethyldihydropteridine diphosphokinase [Opacimonas viscosa]|uniref:2-amino-4-hydroxy-6- hydroxymethyldihydropteridine diphosphokinase n=1 Tax=Opacimonas viscosa TaxID=2961944 RepID=UPI002546410D|nr:2-amino-4-hydroxy-6-hydroxymethyldihydropteridine diphosphokinase [Opacimonas viscosa]
MNIDSEVVYIGLGANLGNPVEQLRSALTQLAIIPNTELDACSHFYSSAPMGPSDQPNYTNAVCRLHTRLAPLALLDALQHIETEHGRIRTGEHWGARTLDLDILFYGNQSIQSERLIVPHYGIRGREFVLVPLFELSPTLVMPDNQPISHWVAECDLTELRRLD